MPYRQEEAGEMKGWKVEHERRVTCVDHPENRRDVNRCFDPRIIRTVLGSELTTDWTLSQSDGF